MELIINIDEDVRIAITRMGLLRIPDEMQKKVDKAIQHGVPLPKGHGRLGDLDALEKEIVNGIKAGNYEEGYETFAHINDMDDCIECVKYADTIIEADKENKKDEHMTADEFAELFTGRDKE